MVADLKPEARSVVGDRLVFVADSFQGMPPPDVARYPADGGGMYHTVDVFRVSQRAVRDNFVRLGLLDASVGADVSKEAAVDRACGVVFLPGFFEKSLAASRLGAFGLRDIAVLRLDADMYGSTLQIFEALYDRVSKGGIVIVDDYSGEACRKAVHDFRDSRGITSPLQPIDWAGRWWIKD
jgi:O-methyltransferase